MIAARLELALRKLESKGKIDVRADERASEKRKPKSGGIVYNESGARVVPQTRASRRWGFGR